jgi:flagellar biosynthetic protein FliQ
MELGTVALMIRESVLQILILAGPVLLIGMSVGLVVSILQATTSIQEQTLTFVPKIAAILVTIMLLGPWMITVLREFTIRIFSQISQFG